LEYDLQIVHMVGLGICLWCMNVKLGGWGKNKMSHWFMYLAHVDLVVLF